MYNLTMKLAEFKNQKIVLLGKSRAFSDEEFRGQLDVHGITLVDEVQEGVKWIIEGRMMTPYEQNKVDELYETGLYSFVDIEPFEKMLSQEIQESTLLMSLKLSGDKERLKVFLQNIHIQDTLFFKLLAMYRWNKEDFFENDDNRDVTAALISRFYKNIERNHNVQYAPTGLFHLVRQTDDPRLLEAISQLEPLSLHPKLKAEIASHTATPKKVLQKFVKEKDDAVLEAMAYNPSLTTEIVKELLENQYLAKIIAQNITLNEELFSLLEVYGEDLAYNDSLDDTMQTELLEKNDEAIALALAHNINLTCKHAKELLSLENDAIQEALFEHFSGDISLLQEGYKDEKNHLALAKNKATPQEILTALYDEGRGLAVVLEALAQNENTPIAILYQLQLDARFERFVKTNEAFSQYIQSQNIGWLL